MSANDKVEPAEEIKLKLEFAQHELGRMNYLIAVCGLKDSVELLKNAIIFLTGLPEK